MAAFALAQAPYIALALRWEVDTAVDDPVQAAIYAPGTACSFWDLHQQTAARFSYGFLIYNYNDGWILVGSECLDRALANTNPQPWITALNRRHPFAGLEIEGGWRGQTRRQYWLIAQAIGMILQVEPEGKTADMLRGYLNRITRGRKAFTPAQWHTMLEIIRERGNRVHPLDADAPTWGEDIRECLQVIKTRRDCKFRLARLLALELEAGHRAQAEGMLKANEQWCDWDRPTRRMALLTKRQAYDLGTLEGLYREQRLEAAEELAEELARQFELRPPERRPRW